MWGILGLFSLAGILTALACLIYGVGPVEAVNLASGDAKTLMVFAPVLLGVVGGVRWVRFVVLKSAGKAKRSDEYPLWMVFFMFGMAGFVAVAVAAIDSLFGVR